MTSPRHAFVSVLDHEIHVAEWGRRGAPAIVMWHGLARTGRDFDELARALAGDFHILCPDTIGRGLSSWSRDPKAEYSIEFYTGIAADLLDHFGIDHAGWIGTSLGGLIGMRMASGPLADRLDWLILNDVGPELPQPAIDRILAYAGSAPAFQTMNEAESWFRTAYAPFGPAGDAFWQRMARTSVRRLADGRLTTHFDPAITVQFTASRDELDCWDRYARITLPTHLLRGATSDILPARIAERMVASGPRPQATVFHDCGHAPSLARAGDHELVRATIDRLAAQ